MRKEVPKRERRDIRVLLKFVGVYCRHHHQEGRVPFDFKAPRLEGVFAKRLKLCPGCADLLRYGLTMRLRCKQEPKPMCKKCLNPCYKPEYRETIREVMKFSGMRMIRRGRIDLLYHYFR
jgi:hypothetical protein